MFCRVVLAAAAILLAGCAPTARQLVLTPTPQTTIAVAPTNAPSAATTMRIAIMETTDYAPTQTRAVELAQIATLTAPTRGPVVGGTIPGTIPPTAMPVFVRFAAADVVDAFRRAGLPAVGPEPLPSREYAAFYGEAPIGSDQVANVANDGSAPMLQVIVFTDPARMDSARDSFVANAVDRVFLRQRQFRHGNVILVAFTSVSRPPDISGHEGAFRGRMWS